MPKPTHSPRLVAINPVFGIYLGGCEGGLIAWWSFTHTVSELAAVTFSDRNEVDDWFAGAEGEPWFAQLHFVLVQPDMSADRISVHALQKAGLSQYLGSLAHIGWSNESGRC